MQPSGEHNHGKGTSGMEDEWKFTESPKSENSSLPATGLLIYKPKAQIQPFDAGESQIGSQWIQMDARRGRIE